MQWTDKTVLITGASSGLGRALAVALAQRGANLVVTARRQDRLETLRDEIEALGRSCVVAPADATDGAAVQGVLAAAFERFERIDVAVLNAGGGDGSTMGEVDAAGVLWQMRTNYDTLVHFLCPLIDHMREPGGTIAYTCSPAAVFGIPKSGPYGASKAAGKQLFECARVDLADSPMRLITLSPGFTHTDGLDATQVPFPALIIHTDRAVDEMIWAMETGRERHMFPKRIAWLITLGTWLPASFRTWLLGKLA